MDYRHTHFQYGDEGHPSEPRHGDSGYYSWESGRSPFGESFSSWLGTSAKMLRPLPWIGVAAIALGILIILFPMLLVMAVAGVFFFFGAACLGLWWHLREQSHGHFNPTDQWDHVKSWFRERFA